MTYGTFIVIFVLACFIAILGYAYSRLSVKYTIKKNTQATNILKSMIQFNEKFFKLKNNEKFSKSPYIEEYLGNTVKTISEIIEKSDFTYNGVKIHACKDENQLQKLVSELKIANDEVKELVHDNMLLVEKMYKYKAPIKFFFHSYKKKATLRILEFLISILEHLSKSLDKHNNTSEHGKDRLENNVVIKKMNKELQVA